MWEYLEYAFNKEKTLLGAISEYCATSVYNLYIDVKIDVIDCWLWLSARRWWWSGSCGRSSGAARCCPRGWGSSTGTSPPSPPDSPPPPHPGTATSRTVLPVFIFCIFPLKCSYWIYWFQGIGKIQSVCPGKFCLVLLTANKFWPNTFVRTSKYWDNIWNANCSVRSK